MTDADTVENDVEDDAMQTVDEGFMSWRSWTTSTTYPTPCHDWLKSSTTPWRCAVMPMDPCTSPGAGDGNWLELGAPGGATAPWFQGTSPLVTIQPTSAI